MQKLCRGCPLHVGIRAKQFIGTLAWKGTKIYAMNPFYPRGGLSRPCRRQCVGTAGSGECRNAQPTGRKSPVRTQPRAQCWCNPADCQAIIEWTPGQFAYLITKIRCAMPKKRATQRAFSKSGESENPTEKATGGEWPSARRRRVAKAFKGWSEMGNTR